MVGQDTNAVAVVAEKLSDSQIAFVYDNEVVFKEGIKAFLDLIENAFRLILLLDN